MLITTIILTNVLSAALASMPVAAVSGTPPAREQVMTVLDEVRDQSGNRTALPPPPREEAVRSLRVTITAYSSTPDQTDSTPFITADGSTVADGIIAANFLPFGTRVRFPELYGDKVFEVHDRMHPRFPRRMDIWMASRREAIEFGFKRNVLLEVLPKETELAVQR